MATARSDARPVVTPAVKPGGRGTRRRGLVWCLSLSAGFSVWLACPSWAAKWDIVPTLAVVETYTDNLNLSQDETKQSDWVTQIIPGISIAATGPQLRFNIAYAPQFTYYVRDKENNQAYHQLSAFGNAELAKQLLFVDVGANVAQYNVSLQGPISTSNVNNTGNRATVGTYFVSPYLIRDFGSAVRVDARYTYSISDSNDASLSDSDANRVNLRVASGPAYKLLTWYLDYMREIIDYQTQQTIGSEVVTANARVLITPTLGLLGSVGQENYTNNIGRAPEGLMWSAGFDWAPTPRTRLIATAGERFYGDVYFLDFRHRTGRTTWSARYSQNITTTRANLAFPATGSTSAILDTMFLSQIPDPVARKKAVEEFIARTGIPPSLDSPINVFVDQLFLEKYWNASVGVLGVNNTLFANVFGLTTAGLDGNLVVPNAPNASIQTGTTFLWNWRLTARNAWNLRIGFSRYEIPFTGQINDYTNVDMNITRHFQRRVSGSLGYRWQHNDSKSPGAGGYTENAVIGAIQMRF